MSGPQSEAPATQVLLRSARFATATKPQDIASKTTLGILRIASATTTTRLISSNRSHRFVDLQSEFVPHTHFVKEGSATATSKAHLQRLPNDTQVAPLVSHSRWRSNHQSLSAHQYAQRTASMECLLANPIAFG